MRPFALDSFGLSDALTDLAGEWRTRHPEVEMRLQIDEPLPQLDDAITTCAYRIVQEALINALRHARATRIDVTLGVEPEALVVRVADNGVGPPPGLGSTGALRRARHARARRRARR